MAEKFSLVSFGVKGRGGQLLAASLLSLACHGAALTLLAPGYSTPGSPALRASRTGDSLDVVLVRAEDAVPPLSIPLQVLPAEASSPAPPAAADRYPRAGLTSPTVAAEAAVTEVAAGEPTSGDGHQPGTYYHAPDSLQTRPYPLGEISPNYPSGIDAVKGRVRLRLYINESGGVDRFEVLHSEPAGIFDGDSILAFAHAAYAPGRLAGRPVKSQFIVDISFDPGEETDLAK